MAKCSAIHKRPLFLFHKYGVWHEKDDWIAMRNAILTDLKRALEAEGIEIPYPHRVVVSPTSDEEEKELVDWD